MRLFFLSTLLAILFAASVTVAHAASPIESLTSIGSGGSTYPLPDPGVTVEHLWITQGASGDFKITPTQLGYILQKTTAPLSPMTYQQWLDTSASPVLLKRWIGSHWVTERSINLIAETSNIVTGLANTHIFVGNGSGVATDVAVSGDVTMANTGAVTIINSAVTTAKINDSAVTTVKIAAGAVTQSKIAGNPVYGFAGSSTAGHPVFFSNTLGNQIVDNGATVPVTAGGTALATLPNHGVLLGQGTAAIVAPGLGISGQPLISAGVGSDPAFGNLNLASGAVTGVLPQANFTMTPTFTSVTTTTLAATGNTTLGGTLLVSSNVTAVANATVQGNLSVTGTSAFTGAITFGAALSRDTNFYMNLSAGNPVLNFNPNTYIIYDRSLTKFALVIGAVALQFSSAGNLTIDGCLNYNGGTLGVCL